ncbi:MAG TPA: membrane integrity-associated transporter subunit PqiC [Gammaproteobacteria bacterium]|nr:membrane integrity-associated transporter subunit PqiC [Gammaproteobacteria bacterium]
MPHRFLQWLVLGLIAMSAGCASVSTTKTRFYALSSADAPAPEKARNDVSIGLGPLEFPQMLDRPQIVTRETSHRITRAEYHQWAGSLKREFLQTLADQLELILGTNRILIYPWNSRQRPDFQIRINISRFDGKLGGEVVLAARWQLFDERGKNELASGHSHIRVKVDGDGYADYVAALSRVVARFAAELGEYCQPSIAVRASKSPR